MTDRPGQPTTQNPTTTPPAGPTRRGAVILAAGGGTRMGGVAKALLSVPGKRSFLSLILTRAREAGIDEAVVVVGAPHAEEVAAHARELGARVVENPDPSRGMASSVALGFAAIAETASIDCAWLWPVDHPEVALPTLGAVMAALQTHAAARPVFDGRGGHPPLIARKLFDALAACTDVEGGARTVLDGADMVDVVSDDPGCVRDIDTLIDLEAMS